MAEVDDFDFICHVAYDQKPLTRRERANNVKKRDFLSRYSGAAREVLEALLDRYMNTGIYEIEKTDVLKLDPFNKFGKPSRIAQLFGGREGYLKAVKANRKLLDKEKEAGRVLDCLYEVSGEKEKSLVFTDENTYLSPISPRALKGRLNDSLNQCFHRKI
jgi:type I site-specific restriction endonuclease